ncbi:MAG: hypothetical protein NTX17_01680 [Candidatus Eisenbacteria bacterium]|nr:hypothetical protein [Candidatus Eisenbacteria bacterium]
MGTLGRELGLMIQGSLVKIRALWQADLCVRTRPQAWTPTKCSCCRYSREYYEPASLDL